jgi:serine O-acetyltransferase
VDIQKLYLELSRVHSNSQSSEFQNLIGFNQSSRHILNLSLAVMFPFSFSVFEEPTVADSNTEIENLQSLEIALLALTPAQVCEQYLAKLPEIKSLLLADAKAILEGDPAAKSFEEVVICYPGFLAIASYRLANCLLSLGSSLLARSISEIAHRETGVDIHPGAKIGERFCIDHGTGIVIGETTVIGNDVKLYHGVTLGGKSVRKDLALKKRHPTIEDNVTIYSNAVILGGDTVIGKGSTIGGNVWLIHSVKAHSVVEMPEQQLIITDKNGGKNAF